MLGPVIILQLITTPAAFARTDSPSLDELSLKVPFVHQKADRDCGPTALKMLLKYDHQPTTTVESIYQPRLGTLPPALLHWLADHRIPFKTDANTLERLIQRLQSGRPVLVLWNRSRGRIRNYHFVVVVGFLKQQKKVPIIQVHDGTQSFRPVPVEQFKRWWQRARYWNVYLTPKTRAVRSP